MRYDPATNRVVGNTIRSLRDDAHEHLQADSRLYSSAHGMLGCVAAYQVALGDLRRPGTDLMPSRKETFVGYIEGTDMILHLKGRPAAVRFLERLDAFLEDLQRQVQAHLPLRRAPSGMR